MVFNAGRVRKAMTKSIRGTSSTREELTPNRVLDWGMRKGARVMEAPDTSTRLKMFAPMTLPRDREPWPLARDVMAVTSSDRLVLAEDELGGNAEL